MDGNIVQKLIHSIKNKITKHSKIDTSINEYAFSSEDLEELTKDNKEKLKELKKSTIHTKKQEVLDEEKLNDSILSQEIEATNTDIKAEEIKEEIQEKKEKSFINLEKEHQELIMKKWQEIDLTEIEKDILLAKDLLNHNYTITFADDATKFIHDIRQKYEVVLSYLIGFNNEKKGIYQKTFFGDNLDNEWIHLKHYIKVLEKIRNFKEK